MDFILYDILKKYGIQNKFVSPYGKNIVKVSSTAINYLKDRDSKLILVTATSPTAAGEGKTTVSIGLANGLDYLGEKVVVCLREPSLGPFFGAKGGATGGGECVVLPEDKINTHFTGDFHAITSAHNLISALIDNYMYTDSPLNIVTKIWPRTIDMNDRELRNIKLSNGEDGSFIITAASEIMALMALSVDWEDFKSRLNKIVIGYDENKVPITVKELKCTHALELLLKDAFNPNVVLTNEDVPAIIHLGPFANIAHGCNSVVATKLGLKISDYVITEAGFGSDLGMEKFLDIKVPVLKKVPNCIVLVTTIRALKEHGGCLKLEEEDLCSLELGISNLNKHIENIIQRGVPFVVGINKFKTDTLNEIELLTKYLESKGYQYALTTCYTDGAVGAVSLAKTVIETIDKNKEFKLNSIVPKRMEVREKIITICKKTYGAGEVVFSKSCENDLLSIPAYCLEYPICIAKTPLSFTGDSKIKGAPTNFKIIFSKVRVCFGAKFIVAETKGIILLPGLSKTPRALHIRVVKMSLIDGRLLAKQTYEKLKIQIEEQTNKGHRKPRLDIILIGDDAPSVKYIETKKKACLKIGMECFTHLFDENNLELEIISLIHELNNNNSVDGIIVQLPIPKKFNKDKILNTIALDKDVDGLTNLNLGNLYARNNNYYVPAAPKGIITIFDAYDINVKGLKVVIIGVSNLIGVPLTRILLDRGATVSLCTKQTKNIIDYTLCADIIISIVGKKNLIKESYVKDDVICIDVGITIEDGKPYGDIEESIFKKAKYFTPTPGGTGPLTVSSLLENLLYSYKKHYL